MTEFRTHQFKVETVWHDPICQRIHKIDSSLDEIHCYCQSELLLAKGVIRREIVYIDTDGRYKKTKDRIEFEVTLAENWTESIPALETKLSPEYFLFQPFRFGNSQAVLEQGYRLVFQKQTFQDDFVETVQAILVEKIIQKGSSYRFIHLPVKFPGKRDRPKAFEGSVIFFKNEDKTVFGEIRGKVQYLTRTSSIREREIVEPISLLLSQVPVLPERKLVVQAKISDLLWTPALDNDGWVLEIKLDYDWFLSETLEMDCVVKENNLTTPGTYKIQSGTCIDHQKRDITKSLSFSFDGGFPNDVNVKINSLKEKISCNGILIQALLEIEVFFEQTLGIEGYRKWEYELVELIPESGTNPNQEALLISKLMVKKNHLELKDGFLKINLVLEYVFNKYNQSSVTVVEDLVNGSPVLAKVETSSQTFSVFQEKMLTLKRKSFSIEKIRLSILEIKIMPKEGWARIEGRVEAVVSYTGLSKKQYEETFELPIYENLAWTGAQRHWLLEQHPFLEYDTFTHEDSKLVYRFLLKIKSTAYHWRELMVKNRPDQKMKRAAKTSLKNKEPLSLIKSDKEIANFNRSRGEEDSFNKIKFSLEKEIPLKLGIPREIVANHSRIDSFKCRDAFRALFIEGEIKADLEYWDGDGFLRREQITFSFWKFLSAIFSDLNEIEKIIPEIIGAQFAPLQAWPWQKGTIKVKVELELKHKI